MNIQEAVLAAVRRGKESLFAEDSFPILRLGKQSRVVLVNMAGWLATEAAH